MADFINPYNFVPYEIPGESSRPAYSPEFDHWSFKEGYYSGRLHCILTTETPIALPDASTLPSQSSLVRPDSHKVYKFIRANGKLAIPGSSLRGMIRSVYEIITNSCFYPMSDPEEKISFRRNYDRITFRHNSYYLLETTSPKLAPCTSTNSLCPACALFGRADLNDENDRSSVKRRSIKGRLSIGWAIANDKTTVPDEKPITLPILGLPKITATSFYLINPDFNNSPCIAKKPEDGYDKVYDTETKKPWLRGRKRYWQHPINHPIAQAHGDKNRTVELVKAKTKFEFDIDFENLSEWELRCLTWSLELEDCMRHSLGYGKPLGYGRLQIEIDKAQSHLVKRGESIFKVLEIDYQLPSFINKEKDDKRLDNCHVCISKNSCVPITSTINYDNLKKIMTPLSSAQVKYPRSQLGNEGCPAAYKWFNRYKYQPLRTINEISSGTYNYGWE